MARKTTTKKLVKPVVRPSRSEPKKPMIGLGTLIAVVVFAALILAMLLVNRQKEAKSAAATPTKGTTFVFDAKEGVPSSIEIKPGAGTAVKVARNEKKAWALELPDKVEADQGLAESAASQVSALQIVSEIDASADPAIFGLATPAYIITFEFDGGKKHTLEIGDSTPTKSGYYARVDNDKIIITDLSGIDALLNLVTSPPYLYTPTPSPTPTALVAPSPIFTPGASIAPTVTVSAPGVNATSTLTLPTLNASVTPKP